LDYYATQIFIARSSDWPVKNYALWRTIHEGDSDYADGKWRWMLFDSDSQALKASLVNDDTLNYVIDYDKMFASLWANETFRNDFKDRILDIADNNFSKAKVDKMFESLEIEMTPRMSKSWARFYGKDNNKLEYFQGKLDSYHEFLINRKSVIEGWFE
ncbi:MAG: CotH kinase family protein, partial [Eubacterium sp.]|nr:CotH kinase family protein [Candidatus Colimonas fimequi]